MSIFCKFLVLTLSFLLFLIPSSVCISASAAPSGICISELSVSAQSAIMLDAATDTVLFAKNSDMRLPMASTTKIMTALIALEYGNISATYNIPRDAIGVEGSSIYLVENEQLTLEELIYALMLESANDAAEAIAIIIAGSTEAFADIMNLRAAELGLADTHFTNPHGLDSDEHYTTAYDLARLASFALKNETFRKIVSTRKTTIPFNNGEGSRLLVNHNRLLREFDGTIGVKTGFTKRSGRCLVSAAERNGLTLIAVTLNAPNDWQDHKNMLSRGFEKYVHIVLNEAGDYRLTIPVCGGNSDWVVVTNTSRISATLNADHGNFSVKIEAPRFVYAPVQCGDTLGKLIYMCDGEILGESTLCATLDVAVKNTKKTFWQWLRSLFNF